MPDRPGETDRGAGHLLDHLRVGQFDLGGAGRAADLAFVGLVIAADQHGDRLAVGHVDQRLDHLLRLALEELRHLLDRRRARAWAPFAAAACGTSAGTRSRQPISAFSWLAA